MKNVTKAPATLLVGPPGAGKTHALTTYLKAGLKLFVLVTDPGGEEALLDACIDKKLPIDNLHWHYVPAGGISWDTASRAINMINTMTYKSLGDMKAGIEKAEFRQLIDVIDAFKDFPCDRTGEKYGPISEFGTDCAIAIDSMTGINKMAKRLTVGGKPNLHQGEWGVAMEAEELFLDVLIGSTKCFVCCTAHVERTMDETIGRPILMASFLGQKLAPRIPGLFSDVVFAKKEGNSFSWTTVEANIDLKSRTLPMSANIIPSFEQVVNGWRKREEAIKQLMSTEEVDEISNQ